jgi:hypothetical protein
VRELSALVLFLLAVYGVANAVVVLKTRLVFQKVLGRVWILRDLIQCPPCVGFWVALAFSRLVLSPGSYFCATWWAATIVDGFAGLGAVWLLHLRAERLAADPAKPLEL